MAACGARRVSIDGDECYALRYDPADADSTMFPIAVALRPGADSGAVGPRAGDGTGFWGLFGEGAWKRMPGDSIRIGLGNAMSEVALVVAHDGKTLRGTTSFYFAMGGEARPVMSFWGAGVGCEG
jgi:hypothetical protein